MTESNKKTVEIIKQAEIKKEKEKKEAETKNKRNRSLEPRKRDRYMQYDINQDDTDNKVLAFLLPTSFTEYNIETSKLILKYITPKNGIYTEELTNEGIYNEVYYRFEYPLVEEFTENAGIVKIQLFIQDVAKVSE